MKLHVMKIKSFVKMVTLPVLLVIVSLGTTCVGAQHPESPEIISFEEILDNDKLGPYLKDLMIANEQGNASEYPQQYHFIEINNGKNVKVVVETYPDTTEQALESVTQFGNIINTYKTYIDAVIAVSHISDLSLDPGISIVRLPHVATDSCREQWDEIQRIRNISNPKLYSPLNLLVLPENQGKIGQMAEEYNIELLEGECLRLIVEADSNNIEEAVDYCSQYGQIETEWGRLIQIVIPVQNLEELTKSPAVQNIRLPYEFWEAGTNGPEINPTSAGTISS
jgi:hypothetical protein